jgi:hypothetical protein
LAAHIRLFSKIDPSSILHLGGTFPKLYKTASEKTEPPMKVRRSILLLIFILALMFLLPMAIAQQPREDTAAQITLTSTVAVGPTPTPVPLNPDVQQTGLVNVQTAEQVFSVSALPSCPRSISFTSDLPDSGPQVLIENALTSELLALVSPQLISGSFILPPGNLTLRIRVWHSGSGVDESFSILVEDLCDDVTGTGTCTLGVLRNHAVNVREQPRIDSGIVTLLQPEVQAPVLQRTSDNQWWQIQLPEGIGWVSRTVSVRNGDCSLVPSIAPVRPTSTPTFTPTFTLTPSPTGPTATITPTGPTLTPSSTIDPNLPTATASNTVDPNVPTATATNTTDPNVVPTATWTTAP